MERLARCTECLPRPAIWTRGNWVHGVQNNSSRRESALLRSKERRKKQVKNLKVCCKQFFAFLFSHIGLSALIVGYTFVGGLMFRVIEEGEEKALKIRMAIERNRTLNELLGVYHVLSQMNDSMRLKLDFLLTNYTQSVLRAAESGWSGRDDVNELSWSLSGSVLYAVTVITTIGYGHVAPRTDWGKFLTMIYALVGIPLTFLFLSNIGDYLAAVFRLLYVRVCRRFCQKVKESQLRRQLAAAYAAKAALSEHFSGQHRNSRQQVSSKPNSSGNHNVSEMNSDARPTKSSVNRQFYTEGYDATKDGPVPHLKAKFYCYARLLPAFKSKSGRHIDSTVGGPPIGTVQLANWTEIEQDVELSSMDEEFCNKLLATKNNQLNTSYFGHNSDIGNTNSSNNNNNNTNSVNMNNNMNNSFTLELSVDDLSTTANTNTSLSGTCRRKTAEIETIYGTPIRSIQSENRPKLQDSSSVYRMRRLSYVSDGDEFCEWDKDSIFGLYQNTVRSSKKKEKITVPISLSLSIIAIYITIGSVIFNYWSSHGRDYLKWSYFCFVTLSTIGFGDIVPGTKIDSDNPQEKMIVVSVYVAIGLSVFAMCFKLMQEEVVSKVKWLGRRLAAIRKRLTQ